MGFTGNIARDRVVLGSLLDRLELPATLVSPVIAHAKAVERSAERLGLVSPADLGSIVPRHSADSLLFALVRRPGEGERWVDVGSGAGFPGLVLAVCFPTTAFTLSEPLQRRAGFLESIAAELGLSNVDITTSRAETLEDAFDVAVARALAAPRKALETLLGIVRPGGRAITAVASDSPPAGHGELVRVADIGNVDSPGLFSMMTREG